MMNSALVRMTWLWTTSRVQDAPTQKPDCSAIPNMTFSGQGLGVTCSRQRCARNDHQSKQGFKGPWSRRRFARNDHQLELNQLTHETTLHKFNSINQSLLIQSSYSVGAKGLG